MGHGSLAGLSEKAELREPVFLAPRLRIVQMRMDDPEQLSANLQRTAEMVRIAPGNSNARLCRGILLYRSGELVESRSQLELARRLGKNPHARLYLGYVYERQGRHQDARDVWEECLQSTNNPDREEHVRMLLQRLDSNDRQRPQDNELDGVGDQP